MSLCKRISVEDLRGLHAAGPVLMVDIRERDEYAVEHIPDARNLPLSELSSRDLADCSSDTAIVFHCQSGNRTHQAQALFLSMGFERIFILEGGLNAWKKNQAPTVCNKKAPLPIMRQVQMIVGLVVLLGVILSYAISPYFIWLSALSGAGLFFAGLTGYCGLAKLLLLLPYNRAKKDQ